MSYQSVFRPGLFAGQTHLVTGGGSGIGRCTAHELAALGAHVVVMGRTVEKLDAVVAEIVADGGSASRIALDIRDEDAIKAAVAQVLAERGRIHGLVNNAGGQFPAPLHALSKNGWNAVVNNNLTGGFLLMREVFNQHMADHGGAIVNMVADMFNGMPQMAHSGAARAGMLNLTQTAAVEWASYGVRVNAIAPGFIASSGMDRYDPVFAQTVIPQMKRYVPAARMGEEAEISAAIVFMLSPAAAYMTGQCMQIDGGSTLNTKLVDIVMHDRLPPFQGFHRAVKPKAVG